MNTKIIDCKRLIKNARSLGGRTTEDAKKKATEAKILTAILYSAVLIGAALSIDFVINAVKNILGRD